MARYRKVDSRIWNDAKFRGLDDGAKLVFFMLLTHPNMTALGAMRATEAGLAEEMGWSAKDFREAFGEALSKGMAEYDREAFLVALPNFLKYNRPESPNVVKAWEAALDLLPECELKSVVIQRVKGFTEGLTEGFQKALPEAFAKGMPYPEQEQEQEPEQEPEKDKGDKSPTVQQVVDLYHEILPELPKVKKITDARRGAIRQRIREDLKTLDDWRQYFEYCRASDFLMGRAPARPGRDPFMASLEWITKPSHFADIIEGKYHQRAASTTPALAANRSTRDVSIHEDLTYRGWAAGIQ